MPPRTQYYETLNTLLDTIRHSRDGTGEWIRYAPVQSSLDDFCDCVASLDDAMAQAQTLTGLEDEIAAIDGLLALLTAAIPSPTSLQRQRTTGRLGYAVNPHAVLRGHLAHAWKRTLRQACPRTASLSIMLPSSWPARAHTAAIRWTTAAGLALAFLAEQAGYRVDIYAAYGSTGVWQQGESRNLTLVRLKASATPWNTHNVAVAASPGFLRRLLFRHTEERTTCYGPNTAYGTRRSMVAHMLHSAVASSGLFPVDQTRLLFGADHDTGIQDQSTAADWLRQQVATLEKEA